MRSLFALLALATATPAIAETNPTLPPEGVKIEILDRAVCNDLQNNITTNPRNIWFSKNTLNQRWVKNSKGDYLSFFCYHYELEFLPVTNIKYIPIVWITDEDTLLRYSKQEREEHIRGIEERQRQVKATGLE